MAVAVLPQKDTVLSHGDVTVSIETIDPKTAEEMLRFNTSNRKLREPRVKMYARQLARGQFGLADQAIGFDADGVLIQGQHRLSAVVLAGVPITTLVMRGLTDNDKMALDTGLMRRPSDVLAWRGEKDVNNLAATIGFLWRLEVHGPANLADNTAQRATAAETIAWLDDHPEIRRSMKIVAGAHNTSKIRTSALAAAHWLTARNDRDDADRFMALLSSREGLFDGSPILALQRWSDNIRAQKHTRPTQHAVIAVVIKAMNSWRRGEPTRQLRWRQGGANAEEFPGVWKRI